MKVALNIKEYILIQSVNHNWVENRVDEWDMPYRYPSDRRSFEWVERQELALESLTKLLSPPARVLEFGCGTGHASMTLAQKSYEVVCTDLSQPMIDRATQNFKDKGLQGVFLTSSVEKIPLEIGKFDGIFSLGVMDYVFDLTGTLHHLNQLLHPGGLLLFTISNLNSFYGRIEDPLKQMIFQASHHLYPTDCMNKAVICGSEDYRRSEDEVRKACLQAGLAIDHVGILGCGARFLSRWIPPRRIIRHLDRIGIKESSKLPHFIGRTLMFVGHQPKR